MKFRKKEKTENTQELINDFNLYILSYSHMHISSKCGPLKRIFADQKWPQGIP